MNKPPISAPTLSLFCYPRREWENGVEVHWMVLETLLINWLYLGIAIVCEVIATSALKATDGFTRWQPSVLVVLGYCQSFDLAQLVGRRGLRHLVGRGGGLVSVAGWLLYQQKLNAPALIGIVLMAPTHCLCCIGERSLARRISPP